MSMSSVLLLNIDIYECDVSAFKLPLYKPYIVIYEILFPYLLLPNIITQIKELIWNTKRFAGEIY